MDDVRNQPSGYWSGDDDYEATAGRPVLLGFELDSVTVPLSQILPAKPLDERVRKNGKYSSILASITEVGVIEPLVVYPLKRGNGQPSSAAQYLLLDGHLRLKALMELEQPEVFCLIAKDDEAFTYNQRVNRLSPIQEHFMILRALERGVSEERIARALKIDIRLIRQKRDLLRGICREAVDLLKNTTIPAETLRYLRMVKPVRQVEIIEMMGMVANYGSPYCQALVAATPHDMMSTERVKTRVTLSAEHVARMQREMETLQRDMQTHEDTYGQNFLNLVVVRGYLAKLLDNGKAVRYLSSGHPDVLNAFQQIVDSTSLEG